MHVRPLLDSLSIVGYVLSSQWHLLDKQYIDDFKYNYLEINKYIKNVLVIKIAWLYNQIAV